MAGAAQKSGNPILDNAGIVAILITIVLIAGFVGAVLNAAGDHGGHGGPPAAGSAHH